MNALAALFLLAAALRAEAPYQQLSGSPLLDPAFTSLDTDLERLHGLADDLSLRMQGSRAEAQAAVAAGGWTNAAHGAWRRPRPVPAGPQRYVPALSESWTEPGADLPSALPNLPPPFFRHAGKLYLVLRREAPPPRRAGFGRLSYWLKRLWRGRAPRRAALYRIDDATGRAVLLFELPAPPGEETPLLLQTAPDRFLLATPGRRMHLVTIDFRPL